jgi:crossover junction endodeoxyribonuclease RusA
MNITLPYPPTVNTYWRNTPKGVLISKRGREYRNQAIESCILQGVAYTRLEGRLAVDITAYMPDRRRRDIDNLTKSLLDSLAHAAVFLDDEQVDELTIRRGEREPPGRIEIEISQLMKH